LKRIILMTALLMVAAPPGYTPARDESAALAEGAIAQVSGQAVVLDSSGKSRPAKVGDVLRGGEIIETRAEGKVRVVLVDKSVLEVRPNSRVQINDSRLNPRGVSSVVLYVGWIWARVTARAGPENAFEVEAATTVAGVRGTELEVAVAEDGSARVGVGSGRAVMENESGSLRLSQGESGEAGYEGAPAAKGSYSAQAEFWLNFLAKHNLPLLTDFEAFMVRVVAAVLDARTQLLARDRQMRELLEDYEQKHPAPRPEEPKPEEKPEPEKQAEPAPEPEPATTAEKAEVASEVRTLYLKARETQKASNRMHSNYYLTEQAQAAVAKSPSQLSPAQLKAFNSQLARVKDVPQLRRQSQAALNAFAAVLERQVNRYGIATSLGRMPSLERNAQIQQILKQIPGAMPPMPGPQSFPKPVMPPMPKPRLP